jgi:hypothetical protein
LKREITTKSKKSELRKRNEALPSFFAFFDFAVKILCFL